MRISNFIRLGQNELNVYENDNPLLFNQELQIYESAEPIGTESFSRSDQIENFTNLEPRIALAYALMTTPLSRLAITDWHNIYTYYQIPTLLLRWMYGHLVADTSNHKLLNQYAFGFF